tara:strand:+ start:583 stop:1083 length:501 start_codon:yes stop_codon:yes gene_type:complete
MESLIKIGLLDVGDEISFVFKKNKMVGKVGYGGHVINTTITRADGVVVETLMTRIYPSLTAWSEACLREGLLEEHTRYASWKRVTHVKSQRTLQSLRSQANVSTKASQASRQDLFMEINRLQTLVSQLKKKNIAPRESAETTDALLMTPSVIEYFNRWATTSLSNG